MKTYNVIHFVPQLQGGVFSNKGTPIEQQLTDVINQQAAGGWEFVTYQTSHVRVQPGCLAGLLGQKEQILYYDVMIFSR
jgi:hypothetical protein